MVTLIWFWGCTAPRTVSQTHPAPTQLPPAAAAVDAVPPESTSLPTAWVPQSAIVQLLNNASHVTLYSIDAHWFPPGHPDRPEVPPNDMRAVDSDRPAEAIFGLTLHDYAVFGLATVSPRDIQPLLMALDEDLSTPRRLDGELALCGFDPHHALQARTGDHVVNLMLCYDCDQFVVYDSLDISFTDDGESVQPVVASPANIQGTSEQAFNETLDGYRIPRIHR